MFAVLIYADSYFDSSCRCAGSNVSMNRSLFCPVSSFSFSLAMIGKLPNSSLYENFAYQLSLLKEFMREDDQDAKNHKSMSARLAKRMSRSGGSFRASIFNFGSERGGQGGFLNSNLDTSVHSQGSPHGSGRNSSNNSKGLKMNVNSSVHGSGNVYQEWKSKGLMNPRKKNLSQFRSASSSNLMR